ncbi:receptor-like protein EIX1 [Lactuca sativa]|uniref:receptor-like protein EIX1 n=1 Tax=Lactuca sativa TaxID=4236 RepID=UPI001C68F58B|nr:receptor-like protein EIX1 [Lactuca sativa]
MNPCVFIVFSFLLICLETTTANPLVATGGGDDNGVVKKCLDKERHALLDFKAHLQDPYETLSTWRVEEEEDCCKWRGVTCNNQTGRVIVLSISSGGLKGEISDALLNLSYLTHLDLHSNSFHGVIPTFIGSMTELRYLDLINNSLHGTIPWSIGSLTKLRYLKPGNNYLSGTIPRSIGSLTELRVLGLSHNSLSGTIPPELGNLTNLQWLILQSVGRCRVENLEWLSHLSHLQQLVMDGISLAKKNHWVDVILSLRKLSVLSLIGCELSQVMYPYSSHLNSSSSILYLYLGNNRLNSSMYHWLFPLTSNSLLRLGLAINMLDGIPKYLGSLCSLKSLYFYNNSAVVEFPVFLKNLSGCTSLALQYLDTSHTQFTGSPSDEIQTLKNLTYLFMSSCNLGPRFLKWTQTLNSLQYLNIANNGISDTIPLDFWDKWPSQLRYMNLSFNNISGNLPDLSTKFDNNSVIDLSSNNFYGQITDVSSTVALLNLSRNKLHGGISFLCQVVHGLLVSLDLSYNLLSGRLPDCLWHFKELKVLILEHNNLSGRLPTSVGSLIKLETLNLYLLFLDLSLNHLHGTIPSCFDNLTSIAQEGSLPTKNSSGKDMHLREFTRNLGLLKSINLSSNNLTGKIPYEVTNLYGLCVLNLSKNALHGEIPKKIGQMRQLETLDLSRNNLSGEMPSSMSCLTSLSYLNVSYNSLSGRIPSGTQLQSFEPSRYNGNPRLCGPPLTKKCPGNEESEVQSVVGKSEGDGEEIDELEIWFYICGASGFVTGFWIACGTLLVSRRGRCSFFHFYDSFTDWVDVKAAVSFANLRRVERR